MSLKPLVVEPAPEKTGAVYVGLCERARLLFYSWCGGKTYQPDQRKSELTEAVKKAFYLHRRRYRARRINAELKTNCLAVGR